LKETIKKSSHGVIGRPEKFDVWTREKRVVKKFDVWRAERRGL
jgi:hypothetical protein